MLTLTPRNGKNFTPITSLQVWGENPKEITKEDFDRVAAQLSDLGQYKPLIVAGQEFSYVNRKTGENMIAPAGTVIGGNSRFLAMNQLGYSEVWVSVITFSEDVQTGKWHPLENGELKLREFDSPEQIVIEYAASDNDQAGKTNTMAMAQLIQPYEHSMPLPNYKFQTVAPKSSRSILEQYSPSNSELPQPMSDEEKRADELKVFVAKFTPEQFDSVQPMIEDVRTNFDLSNDTDVLTKLLEWWTHTKNLVNPDLGEPG